MQVLVLGAGGRVGSALFDHLPEFGPYQLTGLDVEAHPDPDRLTGDLRDREVLGEAVRGQDAIVHAALNPALNHTVTDVRFFPGLLDNLWMTCNVFEAAIEADVDTVVYASSTHAVGRYEQEHAPELYADPEPPFRLGPEVTPRPDSLYGAQKLFDEAIGRLAAELHGISVYVVRIGNVRGPDADHPYAPAERGSAERGTPAYERAVNRMKAVWFSRRDVANFVDCCLRDEFVDFDVFYGVSDNERAWFDRAHARERLGYEPLDAGEDWTAPPDAS